MKLFILMTVVVFGMATGEEREELAVRILETEAELADLNTLKDWDGPEATIYNSLATICSEALDNLKQRYVKQFNVNLDQFPGATFMVTTAEGEVPVTKPTKRQSTGFDREVVVTHAVEMSQEIVNKQVECDRLERKKVADAEPCRRYLNCLKNEYMEDNKYTYSEHPTVFPIEYKGKYASMSTPPEYIGCAGYKNHRRKRDTAGKGKKTLTRKAKQGQMHEEKTRARKRRAPDNPAYGGQSKSRRRRAPYNPAYGGQSKSRRRRAPGPENYDKKAMAERTRQPEFPENDYLQEKSMSRRKRTADNPQDNGGNPKSRTRRTSDNPDNKSVEKLFPSFADKLKSKMNSPKLNSLYTKAKQSYVKPPIGDSHSEMRRNLAIVFKSLIHTALLYKHSYDPVKGDQGMLGTLEIELVDWLTGKLVDLTIKKTLGNN